MQIRGWLIRKGVPKQKKSFGEWANTGCAYVAVAGLAVGFVVWVGFLFPILAPVLVMFVIVFIVDKIRGD